MCGARLLTPLVPLGLRGFFVVVAGRGVWRLPVLIVVAGASDTGDG